MMCPASPGAKPQMAALAQQALPGERKQLSGRDRVCKRAQHARMVPDNALCMTRQPIGLLRNGIGLARKRQDGECCHSNHTPKHNKPLKVMGSSSVGFHAITTGCRDSSPTPRRNRLSRPMIGEPTYEGQFVGAAARKFTMGKPVTTQCYATYASFGPSTFDSAPPRQHTTPPRSSRTNATRPH